jgi:Ca2+-binding EF-hand superfamily protein
MIMLQCFEAIDTDGSDFISKKEIAKALQSLGAAGQDLDDLTDVSTDIRLSHS